MRTRPMGSIAYYRGRRFCRVVATGQFPITGSRYYRVYFPDTDHEAVVKAENLTSYSKEARR